jgi:hypothetical protein
MDTNDPIRRRSPSWVREWSSEDIHKVALRFHHERMTEGLTERQEWLWDALISELEYRFREGMRSSRYPVCSCWLCFGPFDQPELPF